MSVLYILKEDNPPQALQGVGRYYCWLEDTLQTKHGGGAVCIQLWMCVSVCPARPPALAGRINGHMWRPGVHLSVGVCVILVRIWPKLRLNSSLNPLSQCGIAYGPVWLGGDGNVAIDRTLSLNTKASEFVKEEGKLIHQSGYRDLK